MKITDALRGEHAAMRPLLRQIRETTGSGATMTVAEVKCQARALKTIILAHATVEEPYLLKPLGNHEPARHSLAEHKVIDSLLDDAIRSGSTRTLNKVARLTLNHFAEEEQDVFPLAEKVLDKVRLARLGVEWARARGFTRGFGF